ncbi:MAG TPA: retropepsin-like aspartic protease [Paludibacteraceae bacterium]|nr:retropepsin-like aspartic protease [Paludibacteraceae bacterium]HRT78118.1 retropepsin-like aspartic protease [Paludibacteraceae bacterium]
MKALIKFILLVLPLFMIIMSFSGCGGCSKSGIREKTNSNSMNSLQTKNYHTRNYQGKTIAKIENNNGLKYIWVEINGIRLKFIFDTGASNICISSAEATVLYRQGTLQKEDILDIQYFQDATGKVSAGTEINLKTVKIGDRVLHNIEATVIDDNEAPLLLGQSALEKFGKISIDNKNNQIIFE